MEQFIVKNQKKLRCGMTTGTCAAAAATAAAMELLQNKKSSVIKVRTPKGISVLVPVMRSFGTDREVEYVVEKDSGDDPDVTNHALIYACVSRLEPEDEIGRYEFRSPAYPNLFLDGGEGIGRVTREGLEQQIGQAAINVVPRSMIFESVAGVLEESDESGSLRIVIRVPDGEELAKRTFNGQLGIKGGISILGTSGIIEPMSERAIVDTIELQIRQLSGQGVKRLLVTPGNYGQAYGKKFLGFSMEQSVKCSNYIGETLDMAVSYGMESVVLIGNIGKLVKLAAGIMNTHSKVADGRSEIVAVHTVLCGGSGKMAEEIMHCINTDEMLSHLDQWGLKDAVMRSILQKIDEHVSHRVCGQIKVCVILFSEKYGYLGQTNDTD